jgi:hypothetical protein
MRMGNVMIEKALEVVEWTTLGGGRRECSGRGCGRTLTGSIRESVKGEFTTKANSGWGRGAQCRGSGCDGCKRIERGRLVESLFVWLVG